MKKFQKYGFRNRRQETIFRAFFSSPWLPFLHRTASDLIIGLSTPPRGQLAKGRAEALEGFPSTFSMHSTSAHRLHLGHDLQARGLLQRYADSTP